MTKTQDTNDPVLKATLGESSLTAILDSDYKSVNIWHIYSEEKGDMKKMLDDLINQVPTNRVFFLFPFDEEDKELINRAYEIAGVEEAQFEGEDLRNVLDNYKETEEIWNGQEVHLLKCIWKP